MPPMLADVSDFMFPLLFFAAFWVLLFGLAGGWVGEQRDRPAAGFILGILIVLLAAWIFSEYRDRTDTDVPFFGPLPFIGPDDAEE